MKNNLISAIAGWKSAALLALVAMVAAVAFSGVLTNTTPVAEAVTSAENAAGTALPSIPPGGTLMLVTDNVDSLYTVLTISPTSIGKASFVANGGQSLVCRDKVAATESNPCDTDPAPGSVKVSVKIADDSPDGPIIFTSQGFGTPATDIEQTIVQVESGLTPTSITVGPTTPTNTAIALDTDPDTAGNQAGTVELTVTIKNAAGANLTNAQGVLITTNQGVLNCGGGVENVQQCLVQVTGTGTVTLSTASVSGKATVTAAIGAHSLSASTDITFYGTASKISVASDQGAIEIGGSTFVVVTLTDDAGNAVAGRKFSGATDATAKGPSAGATSLVISHTATKPSLPAAIPTCFENVNTDTTDGGTNANGQCVIKVFAPKKDVDPDGPEITDPSAISGSNPATAAAKDAARGEHTVTVALSATTKASVTINVGGPPDSISSDAPASVEPLSETKITVTVHDDEGVRVGGVAIRIDQVEGDGLITTGATSLDTDPATDGAQPTMTVDGKHSFTYLAPRGGTAVFRVQAGTGAAAKVDLIEVAIGEPEPEGPAPTWNQPLATGTHNLVWNGADGADPADAGDVVAIWRWTGSGWDGYFAEAGDVGLANTLTELSNGAAYWVVVQ